MRFYRKSLLGDIRDQTVATNPNLKLRKYFESSDIALVFQELYMCYLKAEVDDSFDDKECFLFPIEVHAELLCLNSAGLLKILSKFGSEAHSLILTRKKTREGTWVKINWKKFRRIIQKDNTNTFSSIAKKHNLKKQEEIEQAESSPEVDLIYTLWTNTTAEVAKPKKCTDDARMSIARAIDKYGVDSITEAINNLAIGTNSPFVTSWYKVKWSLKKFMDQSNGVPNWIEDNWEASSMNPANQADNIKILEATEKDFIHTDEDVECVLNSFDDALDFVEGYNEKDINKTTFKGLISFYNSWEEACNKVFSAVDNEKGQFDIDKFGDTADRDGDQAINSCLTAPTLFKEYKDYLELKVLTKDRGKKNIPLNAGDFDWSQKHIDGFFNYYKRTGASNSSHIHYVQGYLNTIVKQRRSEE